MIDHHMPTLLPLAAVMRYVAAMLYALRRRCAEYAAFDAVDFAFAYYADTSAA